MDQFVYTQQVSGADIICSLVNAFDYDNRHTIQTCAAVPFTGLNVWYLDYMYEVKFYWPISISSMHFYHETRSHIIQKH